MPAGRFVEKNTVERVEPAESATTTTGLAETPPTEQDVVTANGDVVGAAVRVCDGV